LLLHCGGELLIFTEFVALASVSQLVLFDSMFTEEFIKALVFFNSHDVLFGFLRNLLLLDSHVNLEFSLGFLGFHKHAVLNSLLFSNFF
jgi:hypothetical protein